jgi:menaquinone-specific isochorismate synthase
LESQLREFTKEQLEHQLVVDELARAFRKICADFSHDEKPSVLKLSRLQHLRTQLRGELADGLSDEAILEALHPTPATCGSPTREARSFIEKNELFYRGWYAGPLGWISRDDAEFCVAIRSMHRIENRLNVFAGAGIVEGSDAEREWMELEDKISGVIHILAP